MAVSSISVSVSAAGALNAGGPKKGSAAGVGGSLSINEDRDAKRAAQKDDAATSDVPGSSAELRASADTSRKLSDAASINSIGLNSAVEVQNQVNAITELTKKLNSSTPEEKTKIKTEIDSRLQEIDSINTKTKQAIGSGSITVTAVFDTGDAAESTTSVTTSAPAVSTADLGLTGFSGAVAAADSKTAQETLAAAAESVRHEIARLSGNNTDLQAISAARGSAAGTQEQSKISDAAEAERKATEVAQKIREEAAPITSDLRPEKVQSLIVESSINSTDQNPDSTEAHAQAEVQTRDKIAQLLGI